MNNGSAPFRSILFDRPIAAEDVGREPQPEFFRDLNLDQIVDAITAGRDEYNLKPYFFSPLAKVSTVIYRYDIFREFENNALLEMVRSFAAGMRSARSYLSRAERLDYKFEKGRWFLGAASIYCAAVRGLTNALGCTNLSSSGFRSFLEFMTNYAASERFVSLAAQIEKIESALAAIRYSLRIDGKRVEVSRYESDPDYSAEVLDVFKKFKQGPAKRYDFDFDIDSTAEMNHVEAWILDAVAKLFPDVFSALGDFCAPSRHFMDDTVARFDREVQFYIANLEYVAKFKQAGLRFCYPEVSDKRKDISVQDAFDLALAAKLLRNNKDIVTNDFHLNGPERVLIVSGPNQGGKTTFARAFGQILYLASIGSPIPAAEAKLFLCDRTFTHFEKEEDIETLSSKLEDELLRIHRILESATPNSIVIMNESFLSTTLGDALFLSKQVLRRIIDLDLLCVSVTFLDELASFDSATVSMVSTVDPIDPAVRTFKIVRRPADGLAYAAVIAEKYRLTYSQVKSRIAGEGIAE